jgi:hypothetical protein
VLPLDQLVDAGIDAQAGPERLLCLSFRCTTGHPQPPDAGARTSAPDFEAETTEGRIRFHRFHHSLVLLRSQHSAFDHFCVQVESIDHVMRFRNNALRHGVKLRNDLLRHAPSGSIGVYIRDEARGFAVESCTGQPQVDDATHRARILPMAPTSADVWLSPLPNCRSNPRRAHL